MGWGCTNLSRSDRVSRTLLTPQGDGNAKWTLWVFVLFQDASRTLLTPQGDGNVVGTDGR